MPRIKAYAAQSATTPLAPFDIQRRDPGPEDVQIPGSCSAASVIPTCTRRGANGGARSTTACSGATSSTAS